MAAPAGFSALTATRIQDATGTLCVAGTLNILPTDANDQPIGTTAGGLGGPIASVFATPLTISAGVLSSTACVPDTALTLNANICYRFVFKDGLGQTFLTWTKVQPRGASFNLDTYTPNLPVQAPYTPGSPGISAYQLAQQNGFIGTLSQWLATLVGPGGLDTAATHFRGPYAGTSSYAVNDVATLAGVQYICIQAARATAAQPGQLQPNLNGNLFNKANVQTGFVVDITTGALKPIDGYAAIQGLFVQGASNIVTNLPIQVYAGGNDGYVFKDASGTVVGGFDSGNAPFSGGRLPSGAALSIPGNAVTIDFWWQISDLGAAGTGWASSTDTAIVNAGTTLQSSYTPYNPGSIQGSSPSSPSPAPTNTAYWQPYALIAAPASSGVDTTAIHFRGTFAAQSSYAVNDQVTYSGATYNCIGATAPSNSGPTLNGNLFNKANVQTGYVVDITSGALKPIDGYAAIQGLFVQGASNIVTNLPIQVYAGGNDGYVFKDASGTVVGGFDSGNAPFSGGRLPSGAALSIPGNAVTIDFWWQISDLGAAGTGRASSTDTAIVNAGTTLQSSYTPYSSGASSGAAVPTDTSHWTPVGVTSVPSASSPLAGVALGWGGDSISSGLGSGVPLAPLVALLTGMVLSTECSWPGRQMKDALNNTGNTGSPFPTQASIQATKVYVLWIVTNLDGSPNGNLGSASDAAAVGVSSANGLTFAGTYCAMLKGVINQLLAWNPALRIIKAGPYQSANQNAQTGGTHYAAGVPASDAGLALLYAAYQADVAVCEMLYGIPVLNLYSKLGICNANLNTLTVDSVHPTAATQNTRIGPFFARNILPYAGV